MPDDIRHKFGYAAMVEKDAIRAALQQGGLTDPALHFAVERAYCAAHANDPTYRETSARLSEQWREAAAARGAVIMFTWEELERLADLFAGANDPVTAGIADKAAAAVAARI